MARGPETRFIASIHRLLPEKLYRMKNHNAYVGGPADVWYSGHVFDCWIEYKYVDTLPPFIDLLDPKKNYSLSKLQQEWLNGRHDEGRRVFVILGHKNGGIIFCNGNWNEKWNRQELTSMTRPEIARWVATLVEGRYEAPVRTGKGLKRCI